MDTTTTKAADRVKPAPEATPTESQKPQNTAMPSLVEIKKQELEQEVCQIYKEVAAAEPTASWHKQTVLVAAKTGLSPEGIKKMLERNGITNPKKQLQ